MHIATCQKRFWRLLFFRARRTKQFFQGTLKRYCIIIRWSAAKRAMPVLNFPIRDLTRKSVIKMVTKRCLFMFSWIAFFWGWNKSQCKVCSRNIALIQIVCTVLAVEVVIETIWFANFKLTSLPLFHSSSGDFTFPSPSYLNVHAMLLCIVNLECRKARLLCKSTLSTYAVSLQDGESCSILN